MRLAPLDRSQLPAAAALLARACPFDRAGDVAEEKLFGIAPQIVEMREVGTLTAQPLGAWLGDALAGVACVAGNRLRLLAVEPAARGQGVGSALLAACEAAGGVRAVDQPGNYLAPGVDARNKLTIAWLERRGWVRGAEPVTNLLIDVRTNPRVSAARARRIS